MCPGLLKIKFGGWPNEEEMVLPPYTHTHTQTYNSTHTHTYIHTRKQAMYMRANAHTNTNTNTHVQALGKFRTRVGTGMAKIFLERVQGYRWLLLICMNIRFQGEYG